MENLNAAAGAYIIYILAAIFFLLIFLAVWNVMISLQLAKFRKRNQEFFAGKQIKNLDDLLMAQSKNLKLLDKDIQELFNISNQINSLAFKGYHKMGLVRFNPFKDVGGDQSFSLALLNGKNNGLTISSLYTREGARIYLKSITGGTSEKHPLTVEEKKAIEIALKPETK